jgi:hypothetical protein
MPDLSSPIRVLNLCDVFIMLGYTCTRSKADLVAVNFSHRIWDLP